MQQPLASTSGREAQHWPLDRRRQLARPLRSLPSSLRAVVDARQCLLGQGTSSRRRRPSRLAAADAAGQFEPEPGPGQPVPAEQPAGSATSSRDAEEEAGLPHIPWGITKVLQVMFLWLLAYLLVGQVAVPVALALAGLDRDELSSRGYAVLHLGLDVSELLVTLLILWRCLKDYRPLQLGLFPLRFRGVWNYLTVLAACAIFPAVDWLAQQSVGWFPTDADVWTTQLEQSFIGGDWVTNVAYFAVVSICAPIWEEAIFRGFLLMSLTKFFSARVAVLVSSLLFALCHFRLQTFAPLFILGVVFSMVFLKTRNLLPPVLLHSLWNIFVLSNLVLRPGG